MNREPGTEEPSPRPSNTVDIPSLSLPTGGGAIKGIDDKFAVNAVNGTATLSIPLPFSRARDAGPALSLDYNSGAGNGVFGLGWSLRLPSIKRKTEGELPRYLDSDTFIFSNTDDLVPALVRDPAGAYVVATHDSSCGRFTITPYRLRIEGEFSRIERWRHKTTGESRWRVISKDNQTTLFGWSAASRISDPDDESRVFTWLPELVFDDRGNCARYVYGGEDGEGFDAALLHNRNRLAGGAITYANLYLERVLYGNRTPFRAFGDPPPPDTDYVFETVFDYGEYEAEAPYARTQPRHVRRDPFSEYKPGFEIRTTRLCKRALLFHHFAELCGASALVKSLDFTYGDPGATDFAFLTSITEHGYIKNPDGTYSVARLPPIEFEYRVQEWNKDIRSIPHAELALQASGPDGPSYQFIDLYNEGLSGVLTEQGEGWYYQRNLGQGRFTAARAVSRKPSFVGLGSHLQIMDLGGDGRKQLVSLCQEPKGYFELDDQEEWQSFRSFESLPNINFSNANVRLIDLNGDGRFEALISEENVFTWYDSTGRKGFADVHKTPQSFDEERAPQLVFADANQTIFVADMSGDGLTDIVRIRNGQVCYWPNLGHGRFGAKVEMDNAPVFDHPDSFNPDHLRLADIDGSGTTDIIYLGKSKLTCWKNLSGNRFSAAVFEMDAFPEIHGHAQVSVANLLGDGVACIVWSSSLAKDAGAPLKYIDLMSGKKPHVLIGYRNNLGKEVSLDYTSSARFYLDDQLAGRPWVTKLHFPVHCVSKTEVRDRASGHRFVSSYKYHHGYFDHAEREFRGFGMVEQTDSEAFEHFGRGDASNIVDQRLHQAPVVTKHWFHTGARLGRDKTLHPFAHEYWPEDSPSADVVVIAAPGLDPSLVDRLSGEEWREALRACKGKAVRAEVFADDDQPLAPYSVEARNYVVELLQPRGPNQHAVFAVKESETIVHEYDRDAADPRTSHRLDFDFDEYGNALSSAEITYPRRRADLSLPAETQRAQARTIVIYTRNRFTNDAIGADSNRLRMPSEVMRFELEGVARSGRYYGVDELRGALSGDGASRARLIEHVRHTFYDDGLTGARPLHQLDSLALACETHRLAYTPSLLEDVFGARVDDSLMREGRFIHSDGDAGWWVGSGSKRYLADGESAVAARQRFYTPVGYTDPYGVETKVEPDREYCLFLEAVEDAAGNATRVDRFDFRILSPARLRDANDNVSEVLLDELGRVKATAVCGKGELDDLAGLAAVTDAAEAEQVRRFFAAPDSIRLTEIGEDLLRHATTRFVYDLDAYASSGQPAAVASIVREEHHGKNQRSRIQISFEYSSGLGRVVMKKAQAAPGRAKQVVVRGDRYAVTDVDTEALEPRQLRWIGSGRTVLNNKGKTVKEYEPYFAVSHRYEDVKELVETGVTPLLHYDPLGRLTRTELPDATFTTSAVSAWRQIESDANDTILGSAWYRRRVDRLIDGELIAEGKDPAAEAAAAEQAARHAATPEIRCFDVMGRTVLTIEHDRDPVTGADRFHHTQLELDVEGNLRSVTNARGNVTARYKYDLLGNRVYRESPDSGRRWLLANVVGSPLREWDERGHELRYSYDDPLHRPTHSRVVGGDGPALLDHVFDRRFYGEAEPDAQRRNLRGRLVRHYDTGGLVETAAYDVHGRPTSVARRIAKDYRGIVDWTDANLVVGLEDRAFTFTTELDALGKTIRQVVPDGSVVMPSYDEGGLLRGERVVHAGAREAAVYVDEIVYNERGQRERIVYGNGVATTFSFDRRTFRLRRLQSRRRNGDPLQDWHYTFDPVGNITRIEDRNAPVVFFDNQKITSVATYTYDALYRLIEATGRENDTVRDADSTDGGSDSPHLHALAPRDPLAMRSYTQRYEYDATGNLLWMRHQTAGNSWSREYAYEATSNRLIHTRVGASTYAYSHHPRHGFMTSLPHLEDLAWSFREELAHCARQRRCDGGTAETTYYQYDGDGRRIRKVTEHQAAPGAAPIRKDERVSIDAYELYVRHSGESSGLERVSLSVMDGDHRFVIVETRNGVDDGTERRLVRYQLPNHQGSACLELDGSDAAAVISYEEYHPYGTTAYHARNASIRSAAKRYRFTGMERDEESGLAYHEARYYAPWLGRWLSCDPRQSEDLVARPSSKDERAETRGAERPRRHDATREDDPGKTDGPSRSPGPRPDRQEESSSPDREGSCEPKDLNPYSYVSQNPIVYRDPSGEVGIIQAWYQGYHNATTTGAKVGFGILFIFAWIAHVIVNLVVLIAAITILNPAGLFGALDFSWGGLQSVIGLILGIGAVLLGGNVSPHWGRGAEITTPAYFPVSSADAFTLGPIAIGGEGFNQWPHEFGHRFQSLLLGPLYLFIIGIPSAISRSPTFYTEKWANAWAN